MAHQQRDLKREQTWRRHVARQRTSGQTIRAYCAAQQVREASFYFWRQVIAKRDRESLAPSRPATSAPLFLPVTMIDPPTAPSTATPIDIRLAEGHRIRIRAGCDRNLLTVVLTLLRQSTSEGSSC
jgi:hypothetical protein